MEVEEPTAAAVISGALNKCSDFAMRTTEWSALYTLKGGTIAASGALGERVAFQTVVDRTHMELDSAANDQSGVDFRPRWGGGKGEVEASDAEQTQGVGGYKVW